MTIAPTTTTTNRKQRSNDSKNPRNIIPNLGAKVKKYNYKSNITNTPNLVCTINISIIIISSVILLVKTTSNINAQNSTNAIEK